MFSEKTLTTLSSQIFTNYDEKFFVLQQDDERFLAVSECGNKNKSERLLLQREKGSSQPRYTESH